MSDSQLFEDTFTVTSVNSQKYDRVSRISCTSTDNLTTFTLDVNSELYPCAVGESLSLALASTLSLDGKDEDASGTGRTSWREVGMGENTLANEYDYVCHGKVYRFEEGSTAGNMYEDPSYLSSYTNRRILGLSLCRLADFCFISMAHTTNSCR
jgi:DNA-directed RNA polymerases I, II, and III subunit RPABC3